MSDPVIKGVKKLAARPATRSAPSTVLAKNRKVSANQAPSHPTSTRGASDAEKAPARKAVKAKPAGGSAKTVSAKAGAAGKASPSKAKSTAPVKVTGSGSKRQPAAKTSAKSQTTTKTKTTARPTGKPAAQSAAAPLRKKGHPVTPVNAVTKGRAAAVKSPGAAGTKHAAIISTHASTHLPYTQDENAAIRAFERAHKEFLRGRFADARTLFRALIEQHAGAAEVTARARIYLNITESRLRTESAPPRDAEALYDRGVIELNRGEYVAAQEMFERALKRAPEAAHIHYGLAATRARLGSIDLSLQALEKALMLQPSLRARVQHDQDFVPLRSEPDYERLIFSSRH